MPWGARNVGKPIEGHGDAACALQVFCGPGEREAERQGTNVLGLCLCVYVYADTRSKWLLHHEACVFAWGWVSSCVCALMYLLYVDVGGGSCGWGWGGGSEGWALAWLWVCLPSIHLCACHQAIFVHALLPSLCMPSSHLCARPHAIFVLDPVLHAMQPASGTVVLVLKADRLCACPCTLQPALGIVLCMGVPCHRSARHMPAHSILA